MKPRKLKLRRYVERFEQAMERRLRENDHKGRRGWKRDSAWALLMRLRQETDELEAVVGGAPEERVLQEGADVANFAMMIADVRNGLAAAPPARRAKSRAGAKRGAGK